MFGAISGCDLVSTGNTDPEVFVSDSLPNLSLSLQGRPGRISFQTISRIEKGTTSRTSQKRILTSSPPRFATIR